MTTSAPEAARSALSQWRTQLQTNAFDADPHFESLMHRFERTHVVDDLRAFGAKTAGVLDALIRENNRDENLPRLRRYDAMGRRIEAIDFHPSYHQIGRAVYASGVMSRYANPGRELESLGLLYLLSQNGEGGHCCPLACTAGLIKILQHSNQPFPKTWLPNLLNPDYDTHFHGSQFLTEIQGGSDVGSNAVIAHPHADGQWRLTGEKWFCSVIDSHLFLVTARPEDGQTGTRGLTGFVVPRTLDNGEVNHFTVRRLKYKLGTRSMASAEVDFNGAVAWKVGAFRDVLEVVINTSRLYNSVVSCGLMQRAWREADSYTRMRTAFNSPILNFPAVARIVARLRTEAYASRSLTFFLAHHADLKATGQGSQRNHAALRMLVNLNKMWTSIAGTTALRDAIELLGGNGAIEEFTALPRLLRDSIVCEAWEGGHNVLCAQALRDSMKMGIHLPMFQFLHEHAEDGDQPWQVVPRLRSIQQRWEDIIAKGQAIASLHIRDVVEDLRPVAQAAILQSESRLATADPISATAAEHLLRISQRGYDPISDEGLAARIQVLTAA